MDYKIISLDSFNPLDMNMIKSREKWYGGNDHSRWVFEDSGLYYKIWNETYIRKDGVKLGIDCGFYDETTVPAFVGLIYDKDICRGYVTKKCEEFDGDISPFEEIIKNKTKETEHFVYDISDKHIMKYENKFSLIDLEGVCLLSSYEDIANDRFNASFSSENYRKFVYELYKNK
jgi:hypothetical protein